MDHDHSHNDTPLTLPKPGFKEYLPLIAVLLFVVGSAAIISWRVGYSLQTLFAALMGFFFLYFSLFKIISLPDFVMGYQEYDLIAMRVKAWAWIYPFLEAALGICFLLGFMTPDLLWFTVALTALNSTGVLIKLAKHEIFQCACLGTVLKVPLTIVSLIEYAAMGVMAVIMLFL